MRSPGLDCSILDILLAGESACQFPRAGLWLCLINLLARESACEFPLAGVWFSFHDNARECACEFPPAGLRFSFGKLELQGTWDIEVATDDKRSPISMAGTSEHCSVPGEGSSSPEEHADSGLITEGQYPLVSMLSL